MIKLTSFQWSTSEQMWPFEKNKNGNILYCKEIALGGAPGSNGSKSVAHGISPSLDCRKIFSLTGFFANSVGTGGFPLSFTQRAASEFSLTLSVDTQYISLVQGFTSAWGASDILIARIIYSK